MVIRCPLLIKTIFKVLDIELERGDIDFGVIELDSRKAFSTKDIERKWDDQGGLCAITGFPLDEGQFAGDHIVARSMGGKTEYDNLQVIGKKTNIKKSNANNEDYINKIA
jgi:5-methylcytosine-specific restriction endonuclease McrA